MALKALLGLKATFGQRFDFDFKRAVILVSNRHIRGRIRSDWPQSSESQEIAYEEYDEDLTDSPQKDFRRHNPKASKQMSDNSERQEFYDSRRQRSTDVFQRAKQDFEMNANFDHNYRQFPKERQMDQNRNYNRNANSDQKANNYRNYNRNESFDQKPNRYSDYNRNQNFDRNRNKYQNYNRNEEMDEKPNRYRNHNRNENFEKRSNRFDRNETQSRYNDRNQSNDYRDFSRRNRIMESNSEDNDIYNVDNRFDFEDQRPRFSRIREMETNSMNKLKRFQKFDKTYEENRENRLDSKDIEVEDNEAESEEMDGSVGKGRHLIPLPYNITLENRFEVLNQIVMPLHLKPYDIQLNIKYRKHLTLLQKLGKKLRFLNSPVVRDSGGLPCPLESVKPSPLTERYRNKDEFSIWPGVDGFNKTVGFFIGQPSVHQNVYCVEPDQIVVSRESHLSIAKKFQNYLKDVSKYDSCMNYGEGGNWRRFHIRSNFEGHHMATAIMHPQQLTQQELDEEMNRFRQYFEDDPRIRSLYFQSSLHTRLSNEKAPFVHLMGDKTISETLFDKKFEISVDSFFQINSSAAEVLYKNIISEVNPTRNTTVLDICCGTGTLATIMAPDVCRVIGIDSSKSAISDAKRNAALNGVKNVTFIAGTVEQELPKLMDDLYSQDIVVVANPTRAGLHASVINALREINFVRKVVYVSCKPEGNSFKNFIHLCLQQSKQQKGSPFAPTNAVPVDLFPQTSHSELIITFERF